MDDREVSTSFNRCWKSHNAPVDVPLFDRRSTSPRQGQWPTIGFNCAISASTDRQKKKERQVPPLSGTIPSGCPQSR
ncbi:hypothetical protein M514_03901 [Trichuris suis]|uniref:Uncharacterized protein n=1 Tax=Trichuris suis TaxID=68888 RepID=A0A085MDG4_9BILA|nr:hypothetical protein M513_03901 [Trichuris suis]KFD65943.1 hypothetical protein M514_03901 [Trichuris suis]